jgi:hypothetical protein
MKAASGRKSLVDDATIACRPPGHKRLAPDRYVNVPLEPTYEAAYRGLPAFWRQVLEGAKA